MFVQFKDTDGKLLTTDGNLTLVEVADKKLAFYGSKGRSTLDDATYENVLRDIGMPIPVKAVDETEADIDELTDMFDGTIIDVSEKDIDN